MNPGKYIGAAWVAGALLLFLVLAQSADDYIWNGLNGLGLAGFLLLVLTCVAGPSSDQGYSISALRLHIVLMLIGLLAVFVHAVGLLVTNDVMTEYLKWRAPYSMHAGNFALVLLAFLSVISVARVRRFLHRSFHSFRFLHRGLSVVVVGLMGWHIAGTGYLLPETWQQLGFAVALLILALLLLMPQRPRWPIRPGHAGLAIWGSVSAVGVVLVALAFVGSTGW